MWHEHESLLKDVEHERESLLRGDESLLRLV